MEARIGVRSTETVDRMSSLWSFGLLSPSIDKLRPLVLPLIRAVAGCACTGVDAGLGLLGETM